MLFLLFRHQAVSFHVSHEPLKSESLNFHRLRKSVVAITTNTKNHKIHNISSVANMFIDDVSPTHIWPVLLLIYGDVYNIFFFIFIA